MKKNVVERNENVREVVEGETSSKKKCDDYHERYNWGREEDG